MEQDAKRFSSREEDIINRMKERYERNEDSGKVEELSKLDAEAKRYGQWQAISIGIFGALILGAGMSMTLVGAGHLMIPGIFVGLIGAVIAGLAYPVFRNLNGRKKEEITPRIRQILSEL